MPDLESERRALADADRHIATVEALLAQLEVVIERRQQLPSADVDLALKLHGQMKGVLETFRQHRLRIVSTIEDIESGRLPASR